MSRLFFCAGAARGGFVVKFHYMKIQKLFLVLALLVPLAGCGAHKLLHSQQQQVVLNYLSQPAIYYVRDIPPAPLPGSDADKADFALLHEWQAKRTPAQCAAAQAQSHATYEEFFSDISPFPVPLKGEAAQFIGKVSDDGDRTVGAIKSIYKRPRPFHRDAALDPCLGRIDGLAYPSGHSTRAHIVALVLSDLVPARRAEFMARADEAALNRVIGGVHHPSDIAAGAQLAQALYDEMRARPDFIAEMAVLRAKLAR